MTGELAPALTRRVGRAADAHARALRAAAADALHVQRAFGAVVGFTDRSREIPGYPAPRWVLESVDRGWLRYGRGDRVEITGAGRAELADYDVYKAEAYEV
ncbi:hypothetical protein [Streptacidiphilus cavernicola]|uniref:WYL domain-containing protein n=1 Tax=Streptacidiphilus cavernicola TaxID=3342716 RepID=A0ABV6VYA0_9ACTN